MTNYLCEDSMNIEWESIRMSLTLDWISGLVKLLWNYIRMR